MSEAKCPLCGGDLIQSEEFPCFYSCQSTNWKSDANKLCELDDCAASVPVWEALHRARRALDFAVDVAKEIDELLSSNRFDVKEVPLLNITQTKISMLLKCINIEQITALTKGE